MADLIFVALAVGFFAVCIGFVWVCDRIVGPDPAPAADRPAASPPSEPAPAPR